jgi:Leucine-rich repeat (LRR) protein
MLTHRLYIHIPYLHSVSSYSQRDFTNLPHIDKLVNLTDIDLSYNDLSRIPESVYLVESLTRVNMRHNCIKELSSLIDTWHNLVTLDLSHNMITALHPNICKCSKLKRLFLSDNRLNFEGIPAGIGKLSNLVHFVAARNKLECVPEGLCHCYSLKSLVLTSNCLLTLPEAIHFLKLEVHIGDAHGIYERG